MYVTLKVEVEKCNGCKRCIWSCPDPNVLLYVQEEKQVAVNQHRCKGCGLCVTICPKKALALSDN
ncbi:MAG: 4Fe-4S binding protein [Eubacteriales bacterium]|nr:4Fe-4S binding protein [Bacillota bacterium]MBV1728259.1 4Fe-4S binding protein [Desulforudis sp.]MDP3050430.1 4Fe-4S binding protein [Eubacteriales bacterium]MDQ7790180.1 4Fe-4S binding protein [Clostridia bacterium]MBU4533559.1 4Fe-4S binding protein [Bacillota bacterium]